MIVSFVLQNWVVSPFVAHHTSWFCFGVFSKTWKLAAFREIEMILGKEWRNSKKLFNLSYFWQRLLKIYLAKTLYLVRLAYRYHIFAVNNMDIFIRENLI